jgi:hypothetical protein
LKNYLLESLKRMIIIEFKRWSNSPRIWVWYSSFSIQLEENIRISQNSSDFYKGI